MRAFERTFTWRFDSPPDAIWPALADTARFNEAAGLPKHPVEERLQPDGSVRFFAAAKKGWFQLAWEEIPGEWVDGQWFREERAFSRGPLVSLTATATLRADGDAGTIVDYDVVAVPRNPIGWAILSTGFFPSIDTNFGGLARGVREWAAGRSERPFDAAPAPLDEPDQARLHSQIIRIEATANGHGLAQRLADWILAAQETDLLHIRPLALARLWGVSQRHMVELCLQAVTDGMLGMSWDLLCPRCRGAKLATASLDRLPRGAHCDACNIDYERDFSQNVELTFHPAASLRRIDPGEFCLFGPMSTPHVKLQIRLEPGTHRAVPARLAPGEYRVRTLEVGGSMDLDHAGGPLPALIVEDGGVTLGAPAPDGEIVLESREERARTIIVESRAWLRDALTAHRATTFQAFRELFAHEALRPGDDVGIAQVTLMFTDLKGSTALYERVGDAAAYRIVREHFAFLAQVVRRHDGAVVKTIGDAVMAAFPNPADGVRAALAVQAGITDFNRQVGEVDLVIRIGVHAGPSIAVTLNDRLDYFGTTVNLAARLEGESEGGDVIVSAALLADPAVDALLREHPVAREIRGIRGFDQPMEYCRITAPRQAAA